MRHTVSIKSVPKVHVFYPNDDICVQGVNTLLEFAERRGLKNHDRIPYFNRVRDPKIDWSKVKFPTYEHYILQQASNRIKVGDLKRLLENDRFHDTYEVGTANANSTENEYS